jgi:hypothetical protein
MITPLKWDPSRDWVIHKRWRNTAHVAVVFREMPPRADYLRRVRRAFSELRDASPLELRSRIAPDGRPVIGERSGMELHAILERARAESLELDVTDTSRPSLSAIDRAAKSIWLICDDELGRITCEAMIAAGVPVIQVEED